MAIGRLDGANPCGPVGRLADDVRSQSFVVPRATDRRPGLRAQPLLPPSKCGPIDVQLPD